MISVIQVCSEREIIRKFCLTFYRHRKPKIFKILNLLLLLFTIFASAKYEIFYFIVSNTFFDIWDNFKFIEYFYHGC